MQCIASSSVTAVRAPVAARAACATARWRTGGIAAHRRGHPRGGVVARRGERRVVSATWRLSVDDAMLRWRILGILHENNDEAVAGGARDGARGWGKPRGGWLGTAEKGIMRNKMVSQPARSRLSRWSASRRSSVSACTTRTTSLTF